MKEVSEQQNKDEEVCCNKNKIIESTSRRKAVKTLVGGVTALAAYNLLPAKWGTPSIESVFLPAHAATSGQSTDATSGQSTDSTSSGTVTISQFEATYAGSWKVSTMTVTSTVSGTYLFEYFTNSTLTTLRSTDTLSLSASVPYAITNHEVTNANDLLDDDARGDGLWCRVTNTSDSSITDLAKAT